MSVSSCGAAAAIGAWGEAAAPRLSQHPEGAAHVVQWTPLPKGWIRALQQWSHRTHCRKPMNAEIKTLLESWPKRGFAFEKTETEHLHHLMGRRMTIRWARYVVQGGLTSRGNLLGGEGLEWGGLSLRVQEPDVLCHQGECWADGAGWVGGGQHRQSDIPGWPLCPPVWDGEALPSLWSWKWE